MNSILDLFQQLTHNQCLDHDLFHRIGEHTYKPYRRTSAEIKRWLKQIADLALLRGTGARGLRAILEEVLLNTMYELPGRADVGRVVIDADTVATKAS